jgi:hypothetical protein
MAFSEPLDLFLADFGLPVTAGAITGVGILDMPTQVVADGMVLTSDYSLTAKTADFGGLLYGDGITVDGVNYQVREVRKLDDGQFCEISMMKLAPDATAPGGQPREFGLDDLADVELTEPEANESLVYDGTKWVDAQPEPGNLDGGTFN